jgi:hypothetical protein
MSPKLSKDETNLLCWAFEKNQRFSDWLADSSKVSIYTWLDYSDVLTDVNELPIQGIQEKLAEVGDPGKLLPTLSELRAAKALATRNFKVELLLDNDGRFRKPPDISISRGKSKIWVEVMRKFGNDIDFVLHQQINSLLEERDLTLSVSYSERLSELAVDSSSHLEKENMFNEFNEFVEKLKQKLESLAQTILPCKFVLDDSEISIELAEQGWGGISFGETFITSVPSEKYVQQIENAVQGKSSKRESWKEDCLTQPFLIFLDLCSMEFYNAVYQALYGSRNLVDWLEPNQFSSQRVVYPQFVMDKLQGNQQELLFKLGFDSRRRLYIDKPGAFVTKESARRNATGVLTMFNGKIECFPNPFCDELIWLSDLSDFLGVPLTSFAVGGSGQST